MPSLTTLFSNTVSLVAETSWTGFQASLPHMLNAAMACAPGRPAHRAFPCKILAFCSLPAEQRREEALEMAVLTQSLGS